MGRRGLAIASVLAVVVVLLLTQRGSRPTRSTQIPPADDRGAWDRLAQSADAIPLEGRVVLPHGGSTEGAHVYAGELDTRADEDGRFRFWSPTGSLEVEARLERDSLIYYGFGTLRADRAENQIVLRKVEDSERVRVRVALPDGGPVPICTLIYGCPGADSKTTIVRGGSVEVIVSAGWVWFEAKEPRTHAGLPLPAGATRVFLRRQPLVDLQLPAEQTIPVQAVGPHGAPVEGVTITAKPHRSIWTGGRLTYETSPPVHAQTETGIDGAALVRNLVEGEYDLHFEVPPGFLAVPPLRVTSGRAVVVRLHPESTGVVVVVDSAGNPLRGCKVLAWSGAGDRPVAGGFTDETGTAVLSGLDASIDSVLRITPPRERSDLASRFFPRWRPGKLTAELEAGRRVVVEVRDTHGAPVPRAVIEVVHTESKRALSVAQADANGRAVFARLLREELELRAETNSGFVRTGRVVLAQESTVAEVRVEVGQQLAFDVENWPLDERVQVTVQDPDENAVTAWPTSGRFAVSGAERGRSYAAKIGPTRDGLIFVGDVVCRESRTAIRLEAGRRISGRVILPEDSIPNLGVSIHRGAMLIGVAGTSAEGHFWASGMPSGTLRMEAWAGVFDRRWVGTIETEATESPTIHLKRER